jgi:predicted Zn-dependent peptidase
VNGLAAALVLVAGLLAPAAAAGGAVTRHVLPGGMRVLVREDSAAGVVAVSLQARSGPRLEPAPAVGITNFLHRVMIRGAGGRDAAALAEAAEALGGTLEASADAESGEIRGWALARHWEALLALVADVALAPALDRDEVERERRLILSQIQTRADTPFPLVLDTLLADLYGPHPYGVPSLGRRATVERIAREDLVAHHRAIYRADRVVLAVSGGVEAARVLREAERRFTRLPGPAPAAADAAPAPTPRGERRLVARPARQAQIMIGYLAPGLGEPDHAAVRVLSAVLGGGMAGRLFSALRERDGLVYSVGVMTAARPGPGYLVAYLRTAPENAAAAEAGMLRELVRVPAEGVGEAELGRARTYVLGELAMDRRTSARWAWSMARHEVLGLGWDFPDRHARAVAAVTARDVQAAARRYLGRPTIVVLEPR